MLTPPRLLWIQVPDIVPQQQVSTKAWFPSGLVQALQTSVFLRVNKHRIVLLNIIILDLKEGRLACFVVFETCEGSPHAPRTLSHRMCT